MRTAVVVLFVLLALAHVGEGPVNGDAAIYAAQGEWGDWCARPVHLGWIGPAVLLGAVGLPVAPALDVLHVALAALTVWWVGREGGWRSLLAAATVLPLASWAEVDLPWSLGWLAAVWLPGPAAAVAMAWAVATSPTALLALPAAVALRERRGRWAPVVGAVVAVGLLSGVAEGRWWLGGRGVWSTSGQLGLAGLAALWAPRMLPLAWLGRRSLVSALWLLPPLLAPADVCAWLPLALWLCSRASVVTRLDRVAVVVAVAVGLIGLVQTSTRVRGERAEIVARAAVTSPDEVVEVSSWREGVQLSLELTGHPYGMRWRLTP